MLETCVVNALRTPNCIYNKGTSTTSHEKYVSDSSLAQELNYVFGSIHALKLALSSLINAPTF
jgi:hypothetical protein